MLPWRTSIGIQVCLHNRDGPHVKLRRCGLADAQAVERRLQTQKETRGLKIRAVDLDAMAIFQWARLHLALECDNMRYEFFSSPEERPSWTPIAELEVGG